jgi:aldehyde dehydrogenase (NAD+)
LPKVSKRLARRVIDEVLAGGAAINHVALHFLTPTLPFGGIRASGMSTHTPVASCDRF